MHEPYQLKNCRLDSLGSSESCARSAEDYCADPSFCLRSLYAAELLVETAVQCSLKLKCACGDCVGLSWRRIRRNHRFLRVACGEVQIPAQLRFCCHSCQWVCCVLLGKTVVQCSLQCQTDSAEDCLASVSRVILATDPSYSQDIRALVMVKCSSTSGSARV